jgi:hypothetical protein
MSQPVWARPWFAILIPIVLLGVASVVLWRAALYARMNAPMAQRVQADIPRAALFMVLSILLVVGAIVIPLVLRHRAEKRLEGRR